MISYKGGNFNRIVIFYYCLIYAKFGLLKHLTLSRTLNNIKNKHAKKFVFFALKHCNNHIKLEYAKHFHQNGEVY